MPYSEDGQSQSITTAQKRSKLFSKPYHKCSLILVIMAVLNLCWSIVLLNVDIIHSWWASTIEITLNLLTTLIFVFLWLAYKKYHTKTKISYSNIKPAIYYMYYIAMLALGTPLFIEVFNMRTIMGTEGTWTIAKIDVAIICLAVSSTLFINSEDDN